MIGRLTGIVGSLRPDRLILDVGGVGYRLQISLPTFYAMTERRGEQVTLEVHTHVREDALTLFGFLSESERAMFLNLVAVSGVGPKVALAVLSGIGVEELRATVAAGDRARLQKIPGVGKKTAERVLLELRDRLARDRGEAELPPDPTTGGDPGSLEDDAVSALLNLGYREDIAERAVRKARSDDADGSLEDVLRAALRHLVR